MADPIPNKYAVNRGNANVAASPLMPTWDGKGGGIASVDENIGNEVGNAFANRKEYTPLSKYRVRPSSSNHKRSTSSPPARLGNGKQQTVENIRAVKKKKRKRPASASGTRLRNHKAATSISKENNVWKSQRGIKESRRAALSNLTNKKTQKNKKSGEDPQVLTRALLAEVNIWNRTETLEPQHENV